MTNDNVSYLPAFSKEDAERYVKEIAKNSGKVFFTKHARERMEERKITRKEVIECLGRFRFFEEPHLSTKATWQMTIESQCVDGFLRIGLALDNKTQDENGDENFILIITVIDI